MSLHPNGIRLSEISYEFSKLFEKRLGIDLSILLNQKTQAFPIHIQNTDDYQIDAILTLERVQNYLFVYL